MKSGVGIRSLAAAVVLGACTTTALDGSRAGANDSAIWNGLDTAAASFVWSTYLWDVAPTSTLSIQPLWYMQSGPAPAGPATVVWDPAHDSWTTWDFGDRGNWYRRTGTYIINPMYWQPAEGQDYFSGRQAFHYRYVSSEPEYIWMPSAPWLECYWVYGPEVCTYGAPIVEQSLTSLPARIFRREPQPASLPPGATGALYVAHPIGNDAPADAAAGAAGGTAAGGTTPPAPAFTENLLGYAVRDAMGALAVAALPTTRITAVINRLIPLGNANQATNKPHAVVHPSTDAGLLEGATEQQEWNTRRANWNEALGYDCPAVLWDVDHQGSSGEALRRHGHLATTRCVAFRQACVVAAAHPAWCSSFPDASHLTANSNWRVMNRLYLRAPGGMLVIAGKGYLEARQPDELVGIGARIVPGGAPLRDPSDINAEEWHQWKMEYRFGAGQIMYLDHLAHVFVNDGNLQAAPTSMSTALTPLGGPSVERAYAAGDPIGYVFRVEPVIGLRTTPFPNPVYSFGFDWGAYDLVGDPVRFVNAARYLHDERIQMGGATSAFLTVPRSARCPYGAYGSALFAAFDARRGNYISESPIPSDANPCRGVRTVTFYGSSTGGVTQRYDTSVIQDVPDTLLGQWFERPIGSSGVFFRPSSLAISDNAGDVRVSMLNPTGSAIPSLQVQGCTPSGMPAGMITNCMNTSTMVRPGAVAPGQAACYVSNDQAFHFRIRNMERSSGVPEYMSTIRVFVGSGLCPFSTLNSVEPVGNETVRVFQR